MDIGLGPDLVGTGFVCFRFLFFIHLKGKGLFLAVGYLCQIKLTTLSFSVDVKLSNRIVFLYAAVFTRIQLL